MARQLRAGALRAGALGPIGRVQFTQPLRQLTLMLITLGLVGLGTWFVLPQVAGVFLSNVWLNGFMLMVFVIGVAATFWQVVQISGSVRWIEGFVAQRPGHQITIAPRLLAPLAAILRARAPGAPISTSSSRSILETVATRIDEERDITRYLVNLLIFLGLLGTFYGLATSVPAVVETIRALAPAEGGSAIDGFGRLMTGLESQLGGMGVAFSSSLIGLSGSLVVGLLELFASHGQNRFYRELEEWLSSFTRVGSAGGEGEGSDGLLAEGLGQQIDALRALHDEILFRGPRIEEGFDAVLELLEARAAAEAATSAATVAALQRIAEGQEQLIALTSQPPDNPGEAEMRLRLRSMETQLLRIHEEIAAGREESMADLRADLAGLTQAVRHLGRIRPES